MMKKLYILSFVFALVASSSAYSQGNGQLIDSGPIMTFESSVVDYGEIAQNSEPVRKVKFTNTGTEPLVIQSARGSCGCTVPTTPKEPIMPGETSTIEIRYDTKRLGRIDKTVTIITNEGGEPHTLRVAGNVHQVQEDNVPKPTNTLIKPN